MHMIYYIIIYQKCYFRKGRGRDPAMPGVAMDWQVLGNSTFPSFTPPALGGMEGAGIASSSYNFLGTITLFFCSSNLSNNFYDEIFVLKTFLFEIPRVVTIFLTAEYFLTAHHCLTFSFIYSTNKQPLCSYIRSWGQIKQTCRSFSEVYGLAF